RLMTSIVPVLERDDMGARALRLALYRVDGDVHTLNLGLALPTRDVAHVTRLVDLKLEAITEMVDAGFGFEAGGLAVPVAARMAPRQADLGSVCDADNTERCAALIDNLRQRLGPRSVLRLKPIASHIPERAEAPCTAFGEPPVWAASDAVRPRP